MFIIVFVSLMFSVRGFGLSGLGFLRGTRFLWGLRYFQISSLRRAARVLSEYYSVSKTAVWKWLLS
jgi:hypothetical protein